MKRLGKIDKIFVDLDDTLVDFVGSAARLLNVGIIDGKVDYKYFWGYLGDKAGQRSLWKNINKAGPEWWESLPKLPWADNLWQAACTSCPDVIILTSPGKSVGAEIAASGKLRWVFKNYGAHNIIITPHKHMCSSPGALLIDDWDKFTIPWEERGGTALKIKREWSNTGYSPGAIIKMLKSLNAGLTSSVR